jgi:hypothetical protein
MVQVGNIIIKYITYHEPHSYEIPWDLILGHGKAGFKLDWYDSKKKKKKTLQTLAETFNTKFS